MDEASQELVELSAPWLKLTASVESAFNVVINAKNTAMPNRAAKRKVATKNATKEGVKVQVLIEDMVVGGGAGAACGDICCSTCGVGRDGGRRGECQSFVFSEQAWSGVPAGPRWGGWSGAPKWRDCDHHW